MTATSLPTATVIMPAPSVQKAYVGLMMGVIGRGLVSMSQVDDRVRRELSALPSGYVICMKVMANDGPAFAIEVNNDGTLRLRKDFTGRANLTVIFKHMAHAFLVFSFQEGTARAFANDRMFVDGNVSHAVRLVRCLNRMESVILPKMVAERALKRYPHIRIGEKLSLATRTYGRLLTNLIKGQ